jgi:hypothetical protein
MHPDEVNSVLCHQMKRTVTFRRYKYPLAVQWCLYLEMALSTQLNTYLSAVLPIVNLNSSVVGPELFFSDPDPTFQLVFT